ncbi:MAG: hypothetical protein IT436_01170 [Phycisphaerales bacterium]|nr:hypothetical protein [Phycisphaerales bacterium]
MPATPGHGPQLARRLAGAETSCPACGYSLVGVAGPFCPECGVVIPMPDPPRNGPIDAESRCRRCGYSLRGVTLPVCPECGSRQRPTEYTRPVWITWWRAYIAAAGIALLISAGLAANRIGPLRTPGLQGLVLAARPACVALAALAAWRLARPFLLDQPPRLIRGIGLAGLLMVSLLIALLAF